MHDNITAIYDAGVFRPLEPVSLADGAQVSLQVRAISASRGLDDPMDADTKKALLDFIAEMEALPDDSPAESLTDRDHDRLIYGL